MECTPQPDNTGDVIDITTQLIMRRQQQRATEVAQHPDTYFAYPTAWDEVAARRQQNIFNRRRHNGGEVEIEAPMPQNPAQTGPTEPHYPEGA